MAGLAERVRERVCWLTMCEDLLPRGALPAFRHQPAPGHWIRTAPETPLVAFSTRGGGVSAPPYDALNLGLSTGDDAAAVAENRRRLLAALGVGAVAFLRQVHGADVRQPDLPGDAGTGDALVTESPDLALVISTADCLPVFLWNEERTALAAAHAGWRGLAAGVLEAAGRWLLERSRPESLRAAIGPGIRSCCFEVGDDVGERFPDAVQTRRGDRLYLDLAAAARERLLVLGCPPDGIDDVSECTACSPTRYYSHRRDRGRTGRHWAVARLRGR